MLEKLSSCINQHLKIIFKRKFSQFIIYASIAASTLGSKAFSSEANFKEKEGEKGTYLFSCTNCAEVKFSGNFRLIYLDKSYDERGRRGDVSLLRDGLYQSATKDDGIYKTLYNDVILKKPAANKPEVNGIIKNAARPYMNFSGPQNSELYPSTSNGTNFSRRAYGDLDLGMTVQLPKGILFDIVVDSPSDKAPYLKKALVSYGVEDLLVFSYGIFPNIYDFLGVDSKDYNGIHKVTRVSHDTYTGGRADLKLSNQHLNAYLFNGYKESQSLYYRDNSRETALVMGLNEIGLEAKIAISMEGGTRYSNQGVPSPISAPLPQNDYYPSFDDGQVDYYAKVIDGFLLLNIGEGLNLIEDLSIKQMNYRSPYGTQAYEVAPGEHSNIFSVVSGLEQTYGEMLLGVSAAADYEQRISSEKSLNEKMIEDYNTKARVLNEVIDGAKNLYPILSEKRVTADYSMDFFARRNLKKDLAFVTFGYRHYFLTRDSAESSSAQRRKGYSGDLYFSLNAKF